MANASRARTQKTGADQVFCSAAMSESTCQVDTLQQCVEWKERRADRQPAETWPSRRGRNGRKSDRATDRQGERGARIGIVFATFKCCMNRSERKTDRQAEREKDTKYNFHGKNKKKGKQGKINTSDQDKQTIHHT